MSVIKSKFKQNKCNCNSRAYDRYVNQREKSKNNEMYKN